MTAPCKTSSPWGRVQQSATIAAGIVQVSCSGHGGTHLNAARNTQVPESYRNADGWYEEDVEAYLVLWLWPQEWCEHRRRLGDSGDWTNPDYARDRAAATLREHFPDEWEASTGEKVTSEQSRLVADREFRALAEGHWVGVSASRLQDGERGGDLIVHCALGGNRDAPTRAFLVSEADYRAAESGRFVADVTRHVAYDPDLPHTSSR